MTTADIINVSILVIMEVTLKFENILRKYINFDGFNPCYNGSNSKIHLELLKITGILLVSILVIMEVTLK